MNSWKNSAGVWYTAGLFLEKATHGTDSVMYSLSFDDKEVKGKVYPGFYRLYLELEDPTEYEVATQLVGGLEHWTAIANSKVLAPEIASMRNWLNLRLKSKGMRKIIEQAPESFQAAKYLVDQSWLDKNPYKKQGSSSRMIS
jgi:hypothetical protein